MGELAVPEGNVGGFLLEGGEDAGEGGEGSVDVNGLFQLGAGGSALVKPLAAGEIDKVEGAFEGMALVVDGGDLHDKDGVGSAGDLVHVRLGDGPGTRGALKDGLNVLGAPENNLAN